MTAPPESRRDAAPSFLFLLQSEFPINAAILATEAMRIANQSTDRTLSRRRLVSDSGAFACAQAGLTRGREVMVHSARR